MKISLNNLRYYQKVYQWSGEPAAQGIEALTEQIGTQLGGIEEVIDVGSRFAGAYIVRIVSAIQHPDADRLHICRIDDGGKVSNVERDAEGLVQVVCGAPNVREDMMVVWLPPGSTVPESADKEPFVLSARPLRGVISYGMFASPKEMAIGDGHDGILEIDEADIPVGTLFADHYDLTGDVILDIENKMFTHRPDCFGWIGVAREIAGIQQQAFHSPDWYRVDAQIARPTNEGLQLEVHNELPELVPRFVAIVMDTITVKSSPVWLQVELARFGLRPINNIVDLTNYTMLLTGQPVHAYDYHKVKTLSGGDKAILTVRHPRSGEHLTLLNGKTIEPQPETMMVAAGETLACVGGAMGGADTEVDNNTTAIIIEAATWDMYTIRRTAMAHGIYSDAVTRFTKGQSPLQNKPVLAKIVDDVQRITGGRIASDLVDCNNLPQAVQERGSIHPAVSLSSAFVNVRLGLQLSAQSIQKLLSNVEFAVEVKLLSETDVDELIIKAPFWRTDIEIAEDIVEEVGRLYGYQHIPQALPVRSIRPAAINPAIKFKQLLRQSLSRSGANEILSYSFVHAKLLDAVGQKREDSYELSNALSPDLQFYRQSLTPSILDKVHANIKSGYDKFCLFEIGKGHIKDHLDPSGLPLELERLAVVFAADDKAGQKYLRFQGAPYYQAVQYLKAVLSTCHSASLVTFQPFEAQASTNSATAYYQPGRSATICLADQIVGWIGEFRPSVSQALKLPEFCAGFELDLQLMSTFATGQSMYQPLSRYPRLEQDICLKVAADLPYQKLYKLMLTELNRFQPAEMTVSLQPVDIFQRVDDSDHKQITFRLKVQSFQKTLRDADVGALLDTITLAASSELSAERI